MTKVHRGREITEDPSQRTLISPNGKPLATFYHQATPATTYLRCELPARYLPGKVTNDCVLHETDTDYWFPEHEGAAIFQFAGDASWAVMVHGLQAKGVPVLSESDDNYFTVGPKMDFSGWKQKIGEGDHTLEGHAYIVGWVDGCIVTTNTLADVYRQHNQNVFVCPNSVEPADWPDFKKLDDGIIRIGWFASSSHETDAQMVTYALEKASKYPNVQIVTMGIDPSWWRFGCKKVIVDDPIYSFVDNKGKIRRRHIGWQDLQGYREAMFELDVGICPVFSTAWANCRSDIKALEYAMGGAAVVTSDVPPYEWWTAGENCLKAERSRDWWPQLKQLIEDPGALAEYKAAAREYVLGERTIAKQAGKWAEAIESATETRAKAMGREAA